MTTAMLLALQAYSTANLSPQTWPGHTLALVWPGHTLALFFIYDINGQLQPDTQRATMPMPTTGDPPATAPVPGYWLLPPVLVLSAGPVLTFLGLPSGPFGCCLHVSLSCVVVRSLMAESHGGPHLSLPFLLPSPSLPHQQWPVQPWGTTCPSAVLRHMCLCVLIRWAREEKDNMSTTAPTCPA